MGMRKSVAIIGEYSPAFAPHLETDAALCHSAFARGLEVDAIWLSTSGLDESRLREFQGIWIAPGSPYKDMEGALRAIRLAREMGIPCLGTCGGFQHMVIEYARNVLGYADAQHAEYDPYASSLFISGLACSLAGREMQLRLLPGSRVASIYGTLTATEQYYCNFGVNPDCVALLQSRELRIVGSDAEGEVRVMELQGHPFFVGTLFVPQARSTRLRPHPLISAYLGAVAEYGE